MGRRVRSHNLETRSARLRLKVQHKPYACLLEPGLHLLYRRVSGGPGKWIVRHVKDGDYVVENLRTVDGDLILADDYADSDGERILDFAGAQRKAREQAGRARSINVPAVREIVEGYIAERDRREARRRGREFRSDAHRLERYVIGREARGNREAVEAAKLADMSLSALTENDLTKWRDGLPAEMKGTSKKRLINDFKAALSSAYTAHRQHLDPSLPDTVKKGLKLVNGDDDESEPVARDNQILTDAQITRLLLAAKRVDVENEWDGDIYRMAAVLAATGARFSQIARMRVRDCQISERRLMVPRSRKGKGKKGGDIGVPVGRDVIEALLPAVSGRSGDEILLQRWRHRQISGNQWERDSRGAWQSPSELKEPWKLIREAAKMPDVIPYALRHSSIVRGIRENLPLRLVAALHDTSVPMIERHYSRWIVDGLEEMAKKAVVPLLPQEGKVVRMRRR